MPLTRLMAFALIATVLGLTAVAPARADTKLDSLIVYGDGFVFAVKEPTGWHGDTQHAASLNANVIFYPASHAPDDHTTFIRVSVNSRESETAEADLDADMADYRKKYPAVEFKDLQTSHPSYAVAGKAFAVAGQFPECVAYVNPGPTKRQMFSVAMNTGPTVATAEELAAFRAVIASLNLLSAP